MKRSSIQTIFFSISLVVLASSCFVGWAASGEDEGRVEQPRSVKRQKVPSAVATYYEDSSSEDESPRRIRLRPDWTVQAVVGPYEEREWAEIFKDMHEDILAIRQRIGGPMLQESGLHDHMEDLSALVGAKEGEKTICDVLEALITYMNCHLEKAEEDGSGNLLLRLPLFRGEEGITQVETVDQMVGLLRRAEVLPSTDRRPVEERLHPQGPRNRPAPEREAEPSLVARLLAFFFGRTHWF